METAGDISVEKRWTVTKLKRLHHFGVFTVLFQHLAVLTPKFVEPTNPKTCDGQQEQQPVQKQGALVLLLQFMVDEHIALTVLVLVLQEAVFPKAEVMVNRIFIVLDADSIV